MQIVLNLVNDVLSILCYANDKNLFIEHWLEKTYNLKLLRYAFLGAFCTKKQVL
jgi:hypothetical protein